jgi:hypothetical protein
MTRTRKKLCILLLALIVNVSMVVGSSYADDANPLRQAMTRTSMSRTEIVSTLRDAHVRVFGEAPSTNRLAMAWAQVALENGHGEHVFNHNMGNVSASSRDQPTYYSASDKHVYRSFETFIDGAIAYWEVIKRCTAGIARFDWGNPTDAAVQLQRCGYFEADLDKYTVMLSSLFFTAKRHVLPDEEKERHEKEQRDADERREAAIAAGADAGRD